MKHKCKRFSESTMYGMDYIDFWRNVRKAGGPPHYGESIGEIEYVEVDGVGMWVAHCYEYATVIEYCPFCGEKL